MIDDATGIRLSLMAEEETTEACMRLLWQWVKRYGIPKALYTDRKNVFVTERPATLEEQLAGEEPKTVFGKACAKLDIAIIAANSPQAKGRVERAHGVQQDRLVKELWLRGVTTIDGANAVICGGFVDQLNEKSPLATTGGEGRCAPTSAGSGEPGRGVLRRGATVGSERLGDALPQPAVADQQGQSCAAQTQGESDGPEASRWHGAGGSRGAEAPVSGDRS